MIPQVAYKEKIDQSEKDPEPAALPDLESLFFEKVQFDTSIINQLISEYLVRSCPGEMTTQFQEETGDKLIAEIIEKQMKLKQIVPPSGNININEALDWLKNRRNMIKTE